jgi:acid phosphatase (class A)
MTLLFRRLLLTLLLAALPPVYGRAGAFADLSSFGSSAVLPAPSSAAAVADRAASAGHYLSLDGLDLRAVPAPPADGSYEDLEDFRAVLDWQARRTAAQCAAAREEMSHNYEVFFGKITPFASPAPEAVKLFFKNVENDSIAAHKFLKDAYKRERPFMRDARVKPCLPRVKGLSYPSGHSTMSRLFALILADLVPARRAEFIARADQAALNRVIGGVHHPTDTEAGKILAGALYKNLKKQPGFVSDMESLRPLLR